MRSVGRVGDSAIRRARQMRRALTPQEARLWVALRAMKAQGFHFRRQAPFRGYFLDFVCHKAGLAIELDGGHHAEPQQRAHDIIRDQVLQQQGYRTLRFWNQEIADNLDGVLKTIWTALNERPPPVSAPPIHPPHEGGGRTRKGDP
jgi:very-short-patch-repair endonuclease